MAITSPENWIRETIEEAAECNAYPVHVPTAASLPYVRFMRESTTRTPTLDGTAAPVGTFIVEIYAATCTQAKEIADAIREGMDNFSGESGGVTIDDVDLADEKDGDPVFIDGDETPTYLVEQTYLIYWQESAGS
jgi:hypothetical protein